MSSLTCSYKMLTFFHSSSVPLTNTSTCVVVREVVVGEPNRPLSLPQFLVRSFRLVLLIGVQEDISDPEYDSEYDVCFVWVKRWSEPRKAGDKERAVAWRWDGSSARQDP